MEKRLNYLFADDMIVCVENPRELQNIQDKCTKAAFLYTITRNRKYSLWLKKGLKYLRNLWVKYKIFTNGQINHFLRWEQLHIHSEI